MRRSEHALLHSSTKKTRKTSCRIHSFYRRKASQIAAHYSSMKALSRWSLLSFQLQELAYRTWPSWKTFLSRNSLFSFPKLLDWEHSDPESQITLTGLTNRAMKTLKSPWEPFFCRTLFSSAKMSITSSCSETLWRCLCFAMARLMSMVQLLRLPCLSPTS